MAAARVGEHDRAVDLLLSDNSNFAFDDAGLATGGPYPYFPSNGSLLYAVAMLAAGWAGAEPVDRFPKHWGVMHEGLTPAP